MSLLHEYEQQTLVSFEEAIQPLISIVPGIEQMVEIVKQNMNQSADHLPSNESASIILYTLKWKTSESSFQFFLNETLRLQNHEELLPWLPYLRLFIHALSRLPPISFRTVYRGLRMDLIREYSKGEKFIWPDFVSCKSSIEFTENCLYDNEPRAIFIIECDSAKDISQYSFDNNENEILLLPERHFQVISSFDYGNQLKLIQLKEIQQDYPRPQIPSNIFQATNQFEHITNQCRDQSTVDLIEQHLTDADICRVVNPTIINEQCRKLMLSRNKITSIGSSAIARTLNNNNTLEFLSLSYNNLSNDGVQSLIEVLIQNNCKLKILSLHKTGITDKCVPYLLELLEKNITLTWLHLGRNKISDQGIQRLADVLTHRNCTLKALELSHNKLITDASVDSLVEMLKENKTLETLWINNCNLSAEGKKKLQKVTQSNQRFFLLFVKDIVLLHSSSKQSR